ncbi:histone-like nucleoid-structuring protein Lsr2 [Kocuria nitroreducens]|uniref:histone-like nucleoid-structuring protein Lsr2 n=1 Tax=Kocuria nitroreducens TaxID=3058914 RepID=UPI0036D8AA10
MAQTVQIILEDDLDGGPAEETVRFGLDGAQYEIDLSEGNAAKLREAVRPFIAKARRAQSKQTPKQARPTGKSNPDTAAIRQWARENGHPVSDRGRIHQDVQKAYYDAHK